MVDVEVRETPVAVLGLEMFAATILCAYAHDSEVGPGWVVKVDDIAVVELLLTDFTDVIGENPQGVFHRCANNSDNHESVAVSDGTGGSVYIVDHGGQGMPELSGFRKVHGKARAYCVPSNDSAVVLDG